MTFQTREFIEWYNNNGRKFSWREANSPLYQILIAEVLLQKTRAEKLIGVYEDFLNKYSTPEKLANATREEIKKTIQPLGLQNKKSKDLKIIAEIIVKEFDGKVPSSIEDMKSLPRVSDYVANAVQIFGRGAKLPLLDVNTRRVIGRVFSISNDKEIEKKLLEEVPEDAVRTFYYAILDLGGSLCSKKKPSCPKCPLRKACNYCPSK